VGAAALAAKQVTSVIPIVFWASIDPVGGNLVASLARPGGNATGLSVQSTDLASKRVEILREVISDLRCLAILTNVGNSYAVLETGAAEAAARMLDLDVIALEIRRAEDIAPAFEALKARAGALYVVNDPLTNTSRIRINTFALVARLPTMYGLREPVEAGGLMSYGPNTTDLYRRAAEFVDKILRGANPGDIPVEQPTKFDFIINFTTAKALGLEVPPTLLARADESSNDRKDEASRVHHAGRRRGRRVAARGARAAGKAGYRVPQLYLSPRLRAAVVCFSERA
jgi:putative ABC transport system substrate-binding protein